MTCTMSKTLEILKNSGKQPGLQIWAVRIIEPHKSAIPRIFTNQQTVETEYDLIPVPKPHQGVFYSEDMYIVLKTNKQHENRDLHFWFGKDYKDNAPKWVDQFEDLDFTWMANQHFEFQGHECLLFESYFRSLQPAIRYKKGRQPDSGAERKKGITRFYKVMRRSNGCYRVKEIPFNIALMTKEECFILDSDYNTRAYVSDRTLMNERNKSVVVCHNIRELEHDGEGDIEVVDLTTFNSDADRETYIVEHKIQDDNEPEPENVNYDLPDDTPENIQFHMVSFLFSDDVDCGYPPRFRYIPKPKPKKSIEPPKEEPKLNVFQRVNNGFMSTIRKLCGLEKKREEAKDIPSIEEKFFKSPIEKPLKPDQLNSKKIYMLEESEGKSLYLWVGKACDEALKLEITESVRLELRRGDPANEDRINEKDFGPEELGMPYTKADECEKKKEEEVEDVYPRWTHIYKVNDSDEPVRFKKYFQNWK